MLVSRVGPPACLTSSKSEREIFGDRVRDFFNGELLKPDHIKLGGGETPGIHARSEDLAL